MKTSGVFERKVLQLMTIISLLPKIFQLLFLAYSRILKIMFCFDLASSPIKMATHTFFNEGINNLADALPNAQALCFVSPNGEVSIDYPALSPRNLEVTDDPLPRHDSIRQAIKRQGATILLLVSISLFAMYAASIDNVPAYSCDSVIAALTAIAASNTVYFTIVFAPDRCFPVSSRPRSSLLHLSVDQLPFALLPRSRRFLPQT